jgi:hypothetical protein
MNKCNCLSDQFGQTALNTSGQQFSPQPISNPGLIPAFIDAMKKKKKPIRPDPFMPSVPDSAKNAQIDAWILNKNRLRDDAQFLSDCGCLSDQFGQEPINTSGQQFAPQPISNTGLIPALIEATKKKAKKRWTNQPITPADIQESKDLDAYGRAVGTIRLNDAYGDAMLAIQKAALEKQRLAGITAQKKTLPTNSIDPGTNPGSGLLPGNQVVAPAKEFLKKYGLVAAAAVTAIYLYVKK